MIIIIITIIIIIVMREPDAREAGGRPRESGPVLEAIHLYKLYKLYKFYK